MNRPAVGGQTEVSGGGLSSLAGNGGPHTESHASLLQAGQNKHRGLAHAGLRLQLRITATHLSALLSTKKGLWQISSILATFNSEMDHTPLLAQHVRSENSLRPDEFLVVLEDRAVTTTVRDFSCRS